jgi:hypothetical protein
MLTRTRKTSCCCGSHSGFAAPAPWS